MNDLLRTIPSLLIPGILLTGCGSMQNTTAVRDDVYFMPSDAPAVVATPDKPTPDEVERMEPVEDYYDPGTAAQESRRGFYDMTYNDPFYYNYGRFGFGTQLGWQSGWNGPGWGMGMGWNSGGGWNDPWMNMSMGWGSPYYDPWGWNRPWGWNQPWGWNRPYGWNRPWGYDPWSGGYGPYHGPWGGCYSCYAPVVIGGGNQVVERPRTGLGGGTRPVTGQPRLTTRDPAGLRPSLDHASPVRQLSRPNSGTRPSVGTREGVRSSPGIQRQPATRPSTRPATRPSTTPSRDGGRPGIQHREAPSRNGSLGGGSAAPSRNSGGGSGGSNSGGSRSGGGTRPR